MNQILESLAIRSGVAPETLILGGIGLGAALVFYALASVFGQRNPATARMASIRAGRANSRFEKGLLRETANTPKGLLRAAIPTNAKDRLKIEEKFLRAGITNPRALSVYMLVRIAFGALIPLAFIALVTLSRLPGMPFPEALADWLGGMERMAVIRVVVVFVAAGYYLPSAWLDSKVRERQRRVSESFPNALDLMQVAIEAGLGFDAAMIRVANEMAQVSPDIAFEFLTAQHQISAGRSREQALQDMAHRTGVDTVRSFATVVQQSMNFGTSLSEALTTYAREMRLARELTAQEMANKLPVKMSAVLASLMLPALILVTIGPVLIRYVRMFSD
jgi:tight adherence protein C